MNRSFRSRALALVAVVALAAAAAIVGCAKKITSVDASYTKLEGVPSSRSLLFVYPEMSPSWSLWRDLGDKGVGIPGTPGYGLDERIDSMTAAPTGVEHVMVIDGTSATGYELYRTASNGGLERVGNFVVDAAHKWLATQWDIFETRVSLPGSYQPTFIGRGVVNGVAGPSSPLSNTAIPAAVQVVPTISYTDSLTPADSLFHLSWSPVPAASGYWLQVYTFTSRATTIEQEQSGMPCPIWNGNVSNNLVAFVPAPTTAYQLGQTGGATVLTFTPPIHGHTYRVRVTAVDAAGRVIAFMKARDFLDDLLVQSDSTYVRYPMSSVTVQPSTKNTRFDHNFGG